MGIKPWRASGRSLIESEMPRPKFTGVQGQYLSFIDAYGRIHGRAPAEVDLQRHFGVTPPSVHQMILALERKGLITRTAGVARSIELRVSSEELPPLAHEPLRGGTRSTSAVASYRRPRPATKTTVANRTAKRTKLDPATEYIDSSLMSQRLRHDRHVSALIDGRYGVYRVQAKLTRRVDGDCTCPSDIWPCKHVRALHATWARNPSSFFDVMAFLRSLDTRDKAELVDAIGRIVASYPQTLALLGVQGFNDETDDSGDDY